MALAKREPLSLCEGNTAFYIPMGPAKNAVSATGGRSSAPCYVRAAVPSRRSMLQGAMAATAAVALALAGCGGSDDWNGEQSATYPVAVHGAFPARQSLAEHVELTLAVRNAGTRTIPNVAATIATGGGADGAAVEAFGAQLEGRGLASHSRPVWIVDEGPLSGDTAYANTWALGSVAPGRTRTFTWRVVPVRAGRYTLRYRLTGSTSGRSQLRVKRGGTPHGSFAVHVSGKPAQVRVTPDGRIVAVSP
jgi:hypothetical protein